MKKACKLSMSFPRYLKWCVICVGIFFVIEIIVFNTVVLVFLWKFSGILNQFVKAPGDTFIDKLSKVDHFRDLVSMGKEGGFTTIFQHTVGRIYIESLDSYSPYCENSSRKLTGLHNARLPRVSKFGIDVSESGESLYLLSRIKQRNHHKDLKWENLVVDIGANDGLMSSNSNNFIQWGWSAILVEPQNYQLELAKRNLMAFTNQHKDQAVYFVNAVLGEVNGYVNFVLSPDIVSMESHVMRDHEQIPNKAVVKVQSFTVKTFAQKFRIPERFGILSIDAEGMSSVILHQWIDLGYRPIYILYEALHEKESIVETSEYLSTVGYRYLKKIGWNHVFEYYGV